MVGDNLSNPGYDSPMPAPRKRGRPTSLTPRVQAEIVKCLEEGLYLAHAAACAGVTDRSVRDWMKRGEEGEAPFAAFSSAVKVAEAIAARDAMSRVRLAKSGEGTHPWQASAWFLERRFRGMFGRSFVETAPVDGEVIDPTTPEGREKAIADLRKMPRAMLLEALGAEDPKPEG